MKLKIVSDGMPMGTKVMDEDGNILSGVRRVGWDIGVDNIACCTLDLIGVPVEVVSEKVEVSSVDFWPQAQDAPLSEDEASRLENMLLGLKANQFDAVKEVIERAKIKRLVRSITRVNKPEPHAK